MGIAASWSISISIHSLLLIALVRKMLTFMNVNALMRRQWYSVRHGAHVGCDQCSSAAAEASMHPHIQH